MIITKNEFLLLSIKEGLVMKTSWYKSVLALPMSDDMTVKIVDGSFTYGEYTIEGDTSLPLFNNTSEATIPADTFISRNEEFTDTVYGILMNYLLIEIGFNGKAPYAKEMLHFNKELKTMLETSLKNEDMSMSEFYRLANVCLFIRNLAKIVVVPMTEDTYYPPEWLPAFKKDKMSSYVKKYGDDFIKDTKLVTMFENEIMDEVRLKLKDDPTFGITTDKKALQSFKKKFVSIGINEVLTSDTEKTAILSSLEDGYPNTPESVSAVFNSIIYGSEARGLGTVIGGVITKRLLAALHAMKITTEDCKTTDGLPIEITDFLVPALLSLYMVDNNGKTMKITAEFLKSNKGKTINVRTPAYCKNKGDTLCKICSGDNLSMNDSGPVLLAAMLGGDSLDHELSKFHNIIYDIISFTIEDIV